MKRTNSGLIFTALFLSGTALAGVSTYAPTMVGASKTDTKAYAGLRWDVPGGMAPAALVIGVRKAKVKSNGDTDGADASMAFSFQGGVKAEKFRVKGFTGDSSLQWELGAGYNFSTPGLFFGPSANVPYLNIGADYQPGQGLNGLIMPNTLGEPKIPTATPTCNTGDTYNPTSGLCEVGAPA
jgi:hypothetical protein